MHKSLVYIFLLAICLSACSTLRNVHVVEQVDSTSRDNSITLVRDTVVEIVNQIITQTVVEYYPIYDTVYLERSAPVPQPIKSITKTQIRTEAQCAAAKDSVRLSDTAAEVSREYDTVSKESPPSSVISLKWIVIGLIVLLLLALLFRVKILKH